MRISVQRAAKKRLRGYPWELIAVGFVGFVLWLGTAVALTHSQLGQIVRLLIKVVIHFIPPLIWLGGGGLVLLWLIVLNYLWREERP